MSRLRQKYKKLRKEYESQRMFANPFRHRPLALTSDTRPVKTLHKRVVVSKYSAMNESFLRVIDLNTAHEFGENLLESGDIKRDVYDQSEMDFLTGDCLKDVSANEGDLTIMYTLRVI